MKNDQEKLLKEDKQYVENVMRWGMGLIANTVKVERIGVFTREKEEKERYRPLKIHLPSKEIKNQVLQNLTKLKGYHIKITEDLTKNERSLIKEWNQRVEEKNKDLNDENFKWRVRGSPRSGLYFKKIYKCNKSGS